MTLDRKHLLCGLAYAIFGMCVGIYMAATNNHLQHVSHAHILLAGFVVSVIYAVIHKLWLAEAGSRLATVQFLAHQAGVLTLSIGLLLLYGSVLPVEQVEPVLKAASATVLAAAVMMLVMVFRDRPRQA